MRWKYLVVVEIDDEVCRVEIDREESGEMPPYLKEDVEKAVLKSWQWFRDKGTNVVKG